jgi:endonuclease G
MKKIKLYASIAIIGLLFNACSKEEFNPSGPGAATQSVSNTDWTRAVVSGFPETFESGTKTAYAADAVTLSSGDWYLDDALIGNTSSDPKNGTKSVRIRNTGKVSMLFNVTTGASSVTIKHAKYGSDGNSTWELWVSTNSGSSFSKVGSTITTSSTSLQTATFSMSISGNARFELRKVSGGTNRINIDDFSIDDGGSGGGSSSDGNHMAMGNPSGATTDVNNENNYLMEKTQYTLSYNRSRATPNWVSWHVNPSWLGSTARQDDFRADGTLPSGWYQVGATSYSGSGFDRGHNCPSGDRTSSVANNSATFLMTNMIPQAPTNNQQTWANLENYTRSLVNNGYEVYIIMGCYGIGGTGSSGSANTINSGKITVPSNIWKVIVVLSQGTNDVSRVTTTTRIIAVNTPNTNNTSSSWGTYRTSVDAIESATGYNILSNLSTSIQSAIESTVDSGPTS